MTGALEVLAVVLLAGNVAAVAWRRHRRIHAVWALEEAESDWPKRLQDPPAELRANNAHLVRVGPLLTISRDMLTTIPADPYAVAYEQITRAELAALRAAVPLADPDGGHRGD